MSECRSCGQKIVWLKTINKKNIPVDVPKFEDGELMHEYITTSVEFNPGNMTSHFSTCPDAKKWRKKK